MKTGFLLLIFSFVVAPSLQASAAGRACRSAFAVTPGTNRADHAKELREFPFASVADQQTSIDLTRRMIQNLFIDTKLFFKTGASSSTDLTVEGTEARLTSIVSEFADLYSTPSKRTTAEKLTEIRESGLLRTRIEMKLKLSESATHDLIETLSQIQANPRQAAAELFEVIRPSNEASKNLQKAQWRAKVLAEDAKTATAKKDIFLNKILGPTLMTSIFGSIGVELLSGFIGFHLPLLDFNNGGAGTAFMLLLGYPVGSVLSTSVGILAYESSPVYRIKAAYQRYRASRIEKNAITTSLPDLPKAKNVTMERTDAAFENAWDQWRDETIQAEAAARTADTEGVMLRINELTLATAPLQTVEMPNGESFASLAMVPKVLTPERVISIREGYARKINQIDLMLRDVDWIQHDIDTLIKRFKEQWALPSYATPEWLEFNKRFVETTEDSLGKIEALLLANRMRLELTKDRIDAGENAAKMFLKRFATK